MGKRARRLLAVVAVLFVGLVAAAAAAVGSWRLSAALSAMLLAGVGGVGVDLWFRARDLANMQRLASARQRKLGGEANRLALVERRILAAVESERLRAGDRHREVKEISASTLESVKSATSEQTANVESLLQVLPRIPLRAILPTTGGWAMDARSLALLVDLIDKERPSLVVELGGGTSTIWLGYVLQRAGARLVSFEHDSGYGSRTQAAVTRHGLDDTVDLRIAPLVPVDESHQWYDPAAFGDLSSIDLLVVDGPPKKTGAMARWPAVPQLLDRLSPGALVVLDDANRRDERESVSRWLADHALIDEGDGTSRLAVLRFPDRSRE